MIDANYLVEFKRVTNEDLQVAGLLSSILDMSKVHSILDVGAGTGLVSTVLQGFSNRANVTVVEISDVYDYPKDYNVLRGDWADVAISDRFDLVLFSHVLGDFPIDQRSHLLRKGIDCLNSGGRIVSVENGRDPVFDKFVGDIFQQAGDEFDIDATEIEAELIHSGLNFCNYKARTYLSLGRNIEEASRNSNLFFPNIFSGSQLSEISKKLEITRIGDRFVIPVLQNIYVAGINLSNNQCLLCNRLQ